MNGINIGEMLSWLIAFLTLLGAAAVALRYTVEVTVKPALKKAEDQFGIPEGFRKWILPIVVFGVGLYTAYSSGVNFFADAPLPIFETLPGYYVWILNGAAMAGAAMVSNDAIEYLTNVLKQGKALYDVLRPTSYPVLSKSETKSL